MKFSRSLGLTAALAALLPGALSSQQASVTGTVTVYENKYNKRKQLQIVIDRPSQIELSPIPGLAVPEAPAAPAPAQALGGGP